MRVRSAIKSPDNAISHLPVHPPLWASLPDNPLTYPHTQPLHAVPGILELNDICLAVAASLSDRHISHCAHLSITCAPFILLQVLSVHRLNCNCVCHALVLSADLLDQRLGTWAFLTSSIGFCSPTIFSTNIQVRTHHQRPLLLDGCPRFHVDI